MSITTGRTGYRQSLASGTVFETLFDSSLPAICGAPMRAINIEAVTQDVEVRITGLDELGDGTLATRRITAGTAREFGAAVRNSGRILKVEARYITVGALVSWDPVLA